MSRLETVRMPLGAHSYEIRIGRGAVAKLGKLIPHQDSRRAFVISDRRLGAARTAVLKGLRAGGWDTHEIPVRAGEGLKDFAMLTKIYAELVRAKADRHSVLIAVGGGSIGDAAGFVAATYMRGIPWVGVPTTLLAQVDSSVGGKTGINHPDSKNLIGAIHQPSLVVCDTAFLDTLKKRELVSGLGEIVKYGLVFDSAFLAFLVKSRELLLARDPAALARAIRTSLDWKCRAVAKDERDMTGARELLNFGHTFGHALESATGYARYQHGEAVIWGMRYALALSVVRGKLAGETRLELDSFLARLGAPALPPNFKFSDIQNRMKRDKKLRNGRVRFVLLSKPGHPLLDPNVTDRDVTRAYELLMEGAGDA